MIRWLALAPLLVLSAPARAQDAEEPAPEPKLAVVVVGDPDPDLQEAARRVERAVEGRLRAVFDPGLRAALRGEPGERDDGLDEVRRERRRLGLDEARDAGVLASLGRRAGAQAVAIVRAGESGPEVSVLNVAQAAFYEGSLALGPDATDAQIARFVVRRARARASTPAPRAEPTPELPAPELPTPERTGPTDPTAPAAAREPDFFERFWPYLVAGVLLAGMITAIALTSASGGSDQPALRFVPGGR